MSIILPTLPVMPEYPGADAAPEELQNYHTEMLNYQNERTQYYRTLQMLQQQMTEEQTALSNINKAQHDAMMSVIRNLS